jgi:alkyldihydroxyacetonephosphate synthase
VLIDSAIVNKRRRKHWGWGFEDQQPDANALRAAAVDLRKHLARALGDAAPGEVEQPLGLAELELSPVRVEPPPELARICSQGIHARAVHALGKSYADVVRGFRGEFAHPPDVVAEPRDERDLEALLEWCSSRRIAAIPYGGGTSVVGGVTPDVDGAYEGSVSIDMCRFDRVLELDPCSRAARIQAGATGPALEQQLGHQGFTLRHFPQSFELSTLGGWIATRAAGHFATVWTHIEDLVESTRAITPAGAWESRRLPGSGAGISPDRVLAGSEGTLGVISEAWVRVQLRPEHRASAGVQFEDFLAGAEAVRAISQSGLNPANCRLLDAREALTTLAGDGSRALLVLGFESADHDVTPAMSRALEICSEHGGESSSAGPRPSRSSEGASGTPAGGGERRDAVASWRSAFLGAPYLRDVLVAAGVLSETFETAITWERFPAFHERVSGAVREAIDAVAMPVARGAGQVTCRFTHVYPDGPAPYFTVIAPARRGEEVEQWAAIKRAASDAVIAAGGTITHHHAVGRDHRRWYDVQRPDPFASALRGAKAALDPASIMNPGVLLDPPSEPPR